CCGFFLPTWSCITLNPNCSAYTMAWAFTKRGSMRLHSSKLASKIRTPHRQGAVPPTHHRSTPASLIEQLLAPGGVPFGGACRDFAAGHFLPAAALSVFVAVLSPWLSADGTPVAQSGAIS